HAAPRALRSFPTRRSSDLAPLPVARAYANIVRHWVLSSLRAKWEEEKRHEYLSQVEQQFRDVLDFCPAALSATDDDGRLVFHNRDRKSTRLNSSHVAISYA